MNYWIIKSEPNKYSYTQLEKDGRTFWDGVRNYQARNNLREMKKGDLCCYYHSNEGKEIVGLAKVVKESYQDPTTEDKNWVVVDVEPYEKFKSPVSLSKMKEVKSLENLGLIRNGRLSVIKITKKEFDVILKLSAQE
ncbi:MAG: EVE domain-containing protein [Flavobacteriales bacterium]|nr:EVE domain-containing protein [Flavobacteriales bacterium]